MMENVQLEAVNAFFFCLSICAFAIFLHYLVANFEEGYEFLKPSIALTALFGWEAILRMNFWYTRHLVNAGHTSHYPNTFWTIAGSIGAGWAIICCIAVFSPDRWGHKPWIISVFVTAIFLALTLTKVI